jgi:predicted AAA+ superfamily ATPase
MFNSLILLDKIPDSSFFLWGPRQSGKSTWMHHLYPSAHWIDLLNSEKFIKYQQAPQKLRQELLALKATPLVIIDEIQKVPQLLDEVQWLIENQKVIFGLCGSSARKLRRGHANLLGGRATRFEMFGLCRRELEGAFDLERLLNVGYIPSHYTSKNPLRKVRSYITDYLKEEIAAEGLVRNLPAFSEFLRVAAISDTGVISYSTIARDCGIDAETVRNYFQILEDTMIGRKLEAYTRQEKRRVTKAPKFYLFDVGVVNGLAKRGKIQQGSELFGKAYENWIAHELHCHRAYSELYYDLSYWQISGAEVDFILGDMEVAVEVKGMERVRKDHLKGLRAIIEDHANIRKRILVCCEQQSRMTEDGILILNHLDFIDQLWAGELIG